MKRIMSRCDWDWRGIFGQMMCLEVKLRLQSRADIRSGSVGDATYPISPFLLRVPDTLEYLPYTNIIIEYFDGVIQPSETDCPNIDSERFRLIPTTVSPQLFSQPLSQFFILLFSTHHSFIFCPSFSFLYFSIAKADIENGNFSTTQPNCGYQLENVL
jgi:hypothetical protein